MSHYLYKLDEKHNLYPIQLKRNSINNRKMLIKNKSLIRKDFINAQDSIETDRLPNIYNNDKISQQNTTRQNFKNNKKSKIYFSPINSPFSKKLKISPSHIKINDSNNKLNSKIKIGIPKSKSRFKLYKNNSNFKFPIMPTNFNPITTLKFQTIDIDNKRIINNTKKPEKIIIAAKDLKIFKKDKNYYSDTRTGIEENGKSKENNQDASIILSNVCDVENFCIIGVMDGHGTNGHLVSNFVKNKINEYFNNKKIYLNHKTRRKNSCDNNFMDESELYEKIIHNNYEIIRNFYKKVNDELYNSIFDVHFSGSTCILIFKIGNKLICSNVGDSRAILIKNKIENNNLYQCITLSNDQKPNNPEEKQRIEKMGGEVEQTYEENGNNTPKPSGIFRVWKKECDYPGLAISRSLGDKVAELIGVICDPEILEFQLDESCKYIVSGSDGIWEYLSNQDVIDIVNIFLIKKNPEAACYNLIEKATKLWKENEKRVDDITVCVYFF